MVDSYSRKYQTQVHRSSKPVDDSFWLEKAKFMHIMIES